MKYIVIGLGNYGEVLSKRLTELGHDVIGVDSNKSRVDALANEMSATICIDSSDKDALNALPLDKADAVIVAIGENFAASIQTVALLRQAGVKNLIARGLNNLHIAVLQTLGVERVVFPEKEGAENLAQSLSLVEYRNSYKIDDNHYIFQINVPKILVGVSIKDSGLLELNLEVIAIKAPQTTKNMLGQSHTKLVVVGTPTQQSTFAENDVVVIYGNIADFDKYIKMHNIQ